MSKRKRRKPSKTRALLQSSKVVISKTLGAVKTFIVIILPKYIAKFKIKKNIFRFSLHFAISFFILLTIMEVFKILFFLNAQVKVTINNIWLICLLSYLWAALFTGAGASLKEAAKGDLILYFMYYGMYTFWGFVWNFLILIIAITLGLIINPFGVFTTGFYIVIAIYAITMLIIFSYIEW